MTFKPGEVQTEARLNQDDVLAVGKVVFQASLAAAQSIPNATYTPLNWDTVEVDSLTGWAAGTPSRYTPDVAGWYFASGAIVYAAAASTTLRGAVWRKNGSNILTGGVALVYLAWGAVAESINAPQLAIPCNGSTDYIELAAYQSHGSAVNTYTTYTPHITITYGGAL